MSTLLHYDAVAQGEQEVRPRKKKSKTSKHAAPAAPSTLPEWPAPPAAEGFCFLEEEEEESHADPSPALKRRRFAPKPANPSYLLDDLLLSGKTLVVCHSAETLIHKTLAFSANPSLLQTQIPKFLTPTNLPKSSAQISEPISIPFIQLLTAPEKPVFTIPPYLDTDSDCDSEYAPNPPSPPHSEPSSPKPSSPKPSSTKPSSPKPSTSKPSASTSSSAYRGVPSLPFPPQAEEKFAVAMEMLQKITQQLGNLHTQQLAGFAALQMRHDTSEINIDAAASSSENTAVASTRIVLEQVRKAFARGTPLERTASDDADWRRAMTLEVNDARRERDAAVQGERNMRALNVRLLQEINDLRRQLHQEQYVVPSDRDILAEQKAEEDNNRRYDEATARENDRHEHEQDILGKLRAAMYLTD